MQSKLPRGAVAPPRENIPPVLDHQPGTDKQEEQGRLRRQPHDAATPPNREQPDQSRPKMPLVQTATKHEQARAERVALELEKSLRALLPPHDRLLERSFSRPAQALKTPKRRVAVPTARLGSASGSENLRCAHAQHRHDPAIAFASELAECGTRQTGRCRGIPLNRAAVPAARRKPEPASPAETTSLPAQNSCPSCGTATSTPNAQAAARVGPPAPRLGRAARSDGGAAMPNPASTCS